MTESPGLQMRFESGASGSTDLVSANSPWSFPAGPSGETAWARLPFSKPSKKFSTLIPGCLCGSLSESGACCPKNIESPEGAPGSSSCRGRVVSSEISSTSSRFPPSQCRHRLNKLVQTFSFSPVSLFSTTRHCVYDRKVRERVSFQLHVLRVNLSRRVGLSPFVKSRNWLCLLDPTMVSRVALPTSLLVTSRRASVDG